MEELVDEPEIIDYATIPILSGLSPSTKAILSVTLNQERCLPTEDGLPKDWRGLAHLVQLRISEIPISEQDPTSKVLELWNSKFKDTCNVSQLQTYLKQLDRWDIYDDLEPLIETDARNYVQLRKECIESAPSSNIEIDKEILTRHDVSRLSQGLDTQHYDAFILFAEADIAFATELMTNLEDNYNLKLCAKNRDLVGGHVFEHSAIMRLISERCNRLVIVITQAFLESSLLKFFLSFAQALGIEQQERKMVPVILERCNKLPLELQYCYKLDCTTSSLDKYNIWEKLYQSIKMTTPPVILKKPVIRSAEPVDESVSQPKPITEIDLETGSNEVPTSACDKVVTFSDNVVAEANEVHHLTKRPVENWFKKLIHKKEKKSKTTHEKTNTIKKSWKKKLAILN